MIELISLLIQFIIFLTIFSFPFNPKILNKFLKLPSGTITYVDCHALNILFILNIFLISSFLNINISFIFFVLLSCSIILITIRYNEILLFKDKNFIIFILYSILILGIFTSIAGSPKLEWDGHHWITKATNFFHNEGIENLKDSSMPMYPHLGGYVWAFFWKNSILQYEYFGRLFFAYFYIVSVFSILNILKFNSLKIYLFIILVIISLTYDRYLFGGYQEYAIFSILLVSARYITLISFDNANQLKKIYLVLIMMHSMIWFKDEGLFYYLIFGITLILMNKGSIFNKLNMLLFIFITIFIQYYLQKNIIGIFAFNSELINTDIINQLFNIKLIVIKSIAITKHIIIAFIKYPIWILIIFSTFYLITKFKDNNSMTKYFTYVLLLNILFLFAVYLHDPVKDYEFILSVTLDRLIFQTSGFYLINIIFLINKLKIENKE